MHSFIMHCGDFGFLTAEVTTMHDEAVHKFVLCFPKAYQIAILKIAFLSAGLFYVLLKSDFITKQATYISVYCSPFEK